MFIIAMALISGGYLLAYWGIDNIVAWESSSPNTPQESSLSGGTEAVEMAILAGVPGYEFHRLPNRTTLAHPERHEVPFPYHPVIRSSGQARPVDNPTTPNTNPVVPV